LRNDRPKNCSTTPLAQKLGALPGKRVVVVGGELELDGVHVQRRLVAGSDVIVCFARSRRELERRIPRAIAALAADGGLWIAWPKRSSGVATDLNENTLRELLLPRGLVDNKVCAIDDTWSGLRFVVRLANRP
jgi:hypothetical protein